MITSNVLKTCLEPGFRRVEIDLAGPRQVCGIFCRKVLSQIETTEFENGKHAPHFSEQLTNGKAVSYDVETT